MEYKQIHFAARSDWRKWLKENHLSCPGIWFVFYKQSTGKKTISYNDAVEEALCYGWIDSVVKSIDDEKYIQKFTPRTNNKRWSPSNVQRMKKLIDNKKMTNAGLIKFTPEAPDEKPNEKISLPDTLPPFIMQRFKKSPKALKSFNSLAPSYRKNYIRWIISAKKEETRLKRLSETISLLEKNEKLGLR
jgi:uncharacterized protein YdeI (YjbR/CyaY-like superfamily)